ncbi:hypothetical protein CsSME_00053262 [Camellia sinensis var. sinensis]
MQGRLRRKWSPTSTKCFPIVVCSVLSREIIMQKSITVFTKLGLWTLYPTSTKSLPIIVSRVFSARKLSPTSTKCFPTVACRVLAKEAITVSLSSPSLDQGPRASQPLCAGSSQEGNCLPQAPSASQSLRAGSSQERPSYLTVLCSSPSLVQGNCRLQAPSVSQSLHVESSLEKRTDRSILESPSLDQVPHVLHQPSVKTVCRLGPSPPQLVLDSGIRYVVEGKWKNSWFGWMSSETSLSNEGKRLISIYPCGSTDEADAYCLAQNECETDHSVKFYSLYGVNIVIERVQADVHSWIDNKYEYWSKNGKGKSRWWDHIRDEFIQIFRNVMVCLRHIYRKRIYSGKLIDGISVINNTQTKLIWFVKAATVEGQ